MNVEFSNKHFVILWLNRRKFISLLWKLACNLQEKKIICHRIHINWYPTQHFHHCIIMIINTFFHELLPWGGQTKFEFVLKLDRARLRGSNLISPIILWKDNECVLSCALSSTQYCSDSYLIGAASFLEKHFFIHFVFRNVLKSLKNLE